MFFDKSKTDPVLSLWRYRYVISYPVPSIVILVRQHLRLSQFTTLIITGLIFKVTSRQAPSRRFKFIWSCTRRSHKVWPVNTQYRMCSALCHIDRCLRFIMPAYSAVLTSQSLLLMTKIRKTVHQLLLYSTALFTPIIHYLQEYYFNASSTEWPFLTKEANSGRSSHTHTL